MAGDSVVVRASRPLAHAAPHAVPAAGSTRAFAYLALVKPRVVSLVLFTAIASAFAGARGVPPFTTLALLTVAGVLAAGGAAALNHYLDRDVDARMRRTRGRPLVTGQLEPGRALLLGTTMVAAGLGMALVARPALAMWLAAGAGTYVFVYTRWLKRRTPLNIVIGGLAGSFAVLGGWAATGSPLGQTSVLLALLVFVWTPVHFWSFAIVRADDYRRAGIPMLPLVVGPRAVARWVALHAVLTFGVGLWAGTGLDQPLLFHALALPAGGVLVLLAGLALARPTPSLNWQLFKFSGLYLCLTFLGVLLASIGVGSAPAS
ncbi:MAG: protoheme IX farnesyltransferase [Chloroflexi bacterium]|nr:protoheme IX farnesyltransferase [Chloroflexota bacterium]